MNPNELSTALNETKQIALEAGAMLREAAQRPRRISLKGTVDLVTETDKAIEELIVNRLQSKFLEHAIVGEEGTDINAGSSYHWFIDPIDGTTNFAHGFPFYSTSIALCDSDGPLIGVVYDSTRDELFAAARGMGATRNGEVVHCSEIDSLLQALLVTGFPYSRQTDKDNNIRATDAFLRASQGVRRAGSAALELCYIACGRLDGYWEMSMNPWDIAGGMLILTEAGGAVTSYSGDPNEDLLQGPTNIAASNGLIHHELIAILSVIYKEPATP